MISAWASDSSVNRDEVETTVDKLAFGSLSIQHGEWLKHVPDKLCRAVRCVRSYEVCVARLGEICSELGRDVARSEPVSEPLSELTAPGLGEPCRSPRTIATRSSMAFLSLFPGVEEPPVCTLSEEP